MNYTLELHSSYTSKCEELIKEHKAKKSDAHPFSFFVRISENRFFMLNSHSKECFEKKLKAVLKWNNYPFSIFYQNQYFSPSEHIDFLNEFESNMSRKGRRPALFITPTDIEYNIEFEEQ